MPTLMGAAAAGGLPTGAMPLVLFGIVFFWQLPHAMAIAWLHRADVARGPGVLPSALHAFGRILEVDGCGGRVRPEWLPKPTGRGPWA